MFQNAHAKIKPKTGKNCSFLVWLIRQKGYENLHDVNIAEVYLHYNATDKNKATDFLNQAARDASDQLTLDSYEIVVTALAQQKIQSHRQLQMRPQQEHNTLPPISEKIALLLTRLYKSQIQGYLRRTQTS